ncbi:MAG: hypothetical protein AAGA91_18880 [Pseudomonadota bacterium]
MRSTVFANRRFPSIAWTPSSGLNPGSARHGGLAALLLFAALTACGPAKVTVEGQYPPPLVEPLPVTIGVWYNEEFRTHEFFDDASKRNEASWIVQTGAAQVEMWDTVLAGMFTEVIHLEEAPGAGVFTEVMDGVLILHVDELQYSIPAHTNIKVYEIWMRYRFELVNSGGETLAEWTMTSYGKTPTAFLRTDEAAVNLAAVMALRDAGANFITSFKRTPELKPWLQERGLIPQGEAP